MDYYNKSKEELIVDLQKLQADYDLFKIWHEKELAELKLTNESIIANEQKYRLLAEQMTDVIWELDLNYTFTYISSGIEKLTGFLPTEFIGKLVYESIEPNMVIQLKAISDQRLENYRATGEIKSTIFEFKQVCKNGEFVWVEALSNPKFDHNNKLIGFQGVTRNISEWKEANEALKLSEEKLSTVFHTAPYVITIMRISDQRLIDVNRAAEIFTGYTREELLTDSTISLVIWDDPKQRTDYFEAIKRHEPLKQYDLRYKSKSGEIGNALLSTEYIKIDNEICVLGFFEVISNRKKTEQKLIESEKQFRLIFENSNDAIFWAEASTGIIIQCNKAAENLVERSQSEIIGKHHSILHPIDAREKHILEFEKHVDLKGSILLDTEVITKSGKIRIVEVSSTLITIEGKEINQGIFKDITDKKRMEEALRNVVVASASNDEESIFSTLAANLAKALQVKEALIGQLDGKENEKIHSLAYFKNNAIINNVTYDLLGTPCFDVLKYGKNVVLHDVAKLYPSDTALKERGVETYIGMALNNSKGERLGLMAILHDKELVQISEAESILSLFSYRAASELERKQPKIPCLKTEPI